MKGVIQNEEYLELVLREGREFVLVCESENDANSKRVSLFNAKKRMSPDKQRRIQIKKFKEGDKWFVKIKRGSTEVYEVVDGEMKKVEEVYELSTRSLKLIGDMKENGVGAEDMVEILVGRGEEEGSVRAELKKMGLVD